MVAVTTSLVERAERIFRDLGYTVSNEGTELRAERKWRSVRITPVDESPTVPSADDFHCFVTRAEQAREIRDELAARHRNCEWAVLGVTDDGGYEVHRSPTDPAAA